MSSIDHLPGIHSSYVKTKRLKMHLLSAGERSNPAILFLHGNASTSTIWEELMLELSDEYYCLAPDLRGYGQTDSSKIIDATRGAMDWVDDISALTEELHLDSFKLVGHSLGGWICWSLIPELYQKIDTVCLMAPGPPYGFGGIHGKTGEPNNPDYSGSGAGVVNDKFVQELNAQNRENDDSLFSPRNVMNRLYWKEGFKAEREEEILSAMLQIHLDEHQYPGDHTQSEYWPHVAPGKFGPVNALSPKYNKKVLEKFISIPEKPPILWIHGNDDHIIADESYSDPGFQGKAGLRENWPGEETFPPQPMITQISYALVQYARSGGKVEKLFVDNSGHTPFLERPAITLKTLRTFFKA
ncbi:MAG: alpha/beta hydrolase [Gracilimonas sp.]